jgi:hypothetical protein
MGPCRENALFILAYDAPSGSSGSRTSSHRTGRAGSASRPATGPRTARRRQGS